MADKLSILVNTLLHTDEAKMQSQLNALSKKAKMTINPRVDLSPESIAKFKSDIDKMAKQIKVNLVIGVDKSSLSAAEKAVQDASKKIRDKASQSKTGVQLFDRAKLQRDGIDIINQTGNIVDKVKQKFALKGDVNVSFLKNSKQQIVGLVAEITKANGIVEQFKYKLGEFKQGGKGYILDSSKLVDKNAGKNLQDMINKLQAYQNKIDSMKTKFTSPTTGIQDTGNLANLNTKYNEIKATIESTKNTSNSLSNEQRRGIIQNIADLNRLITTYKDLQTAQNKSANNSKSTQDIEMMVNRWTNALKQMQVGKDKVFKNVGVQGDLSVVNQAINNFKSGTGTVNQVTMAMNNLKTSVKQVGDNFRNTNKDGYSFGAMIELAVKKVAVWAVSTQLIYGSLRQLKEGFDFIKESSAAFTTLQMEMTDTNLVFKDVLTSANDYANALGSTTSQVMKAIGVFSTYTSTMDEVLSKSKSATVLSNLTGQSIESQADDIMGIMSQFRVASGDSMYVADTLAATARTLAIDYPKAIQELSSGVRSAGSVAKESGASLEEFTSMIGVITEKTRKSGSEAGNSLRTIFGRILNVGEEADPEQMKKVEQSLDGIGVKIRELGDDGNLRPIGKILGDLASKWSTLTEAQRQQIAFEAAGNLLPEYTVMYIENFSNCWKILRVL